MKQLVIIALALLMMAPCADAGRRKKPSGTIKDVVFTDLDYGFTIKGHDNWKAKVYKHDSNVRVAFTQIDFAVPTHYMSVPDYTKIPRITVYVDTSSQNVHVLLDSLLSDDFKSEQKKEIINEFDFLQRTEIIDGDILPRGRTRLEIDGESAVLWKGQTKYMQLVQTSAGSAGVRRVRDAFGGAIAAVKHDKYVVLMHLMCEWQYYDQVLAEAQAIMLSLDFPDEDEGK